MSVATAVNRPTATSSAVSLAALGVAVGVLLPGGETQSALAVELVGLGGIVAGTALFRRNRRLVGVVALLAGGGATLLALAWALTGTRGLDELVVVLPGFVGVAVLTGGLAPVRGCGSRALVKLGTGAAFVSVLGAGLFHLVPLSTLLAAAVGTVVAWDAGDRAISLGEQLGRVATTRRLEVVRAGSSLLVGGIAVAVAPLVEGVGSSGMPLAALVALLVAVLSLSAALHG